MRAEYDSEADALAIDLVENPVAARAVGDDDRCTVALDDRGRPVGVEVLYPSKPFEALLAGAAARHDLDAEALVAAARSALAAPDRVVVERAQPPDPERVAAPAGAPRLTAWGLDAHRPADV